MIQIFCHRAGCVSVDKVKKKGDRPSGWNMVKLNGGREILYCDLHLISVEVKDRYWERKMIERGLKKSLKDVGEGIYKGIS